MDILIDICHPAHVHLFKHLYFELAKKYPKPVVTVREIPSAIELLKHYNIPYIVIGTKHESLFKKAFSQFYYLCELYKIARRENIEIAIGTSLNIAHLSKISQVKSVVLDDDDDIVEPLFVKFGHPFVDYLLSPDSLKADRKKKGTIFHPSTHECAYLHPSRFVPDPNILNQLGIKDQKFFILRFNAFKAHHDVGHGGLSSAQQQKLVNLLTPHGEVFITTEGEINESLKQYQLQIEANKIHDILYYAHMFIGDSQTMTTEAAILGTPSFKCNSFAGILSVPNEIEHKYGLCKSFKTDQFDEMCAEIENQIASPTLKETHREKRDRFFQDKIDLSQFLVWFCEKVHREEWNSNSRIPWEDFK